MADDVSLYVQDESSDILEEDLLEDWYTYIYHNTPSHLLEEDSPYIEECRHRRGHGI